MIEKLKERHQTLVEGLAKLYMQKDDIEKQIAIQRAAIQECSMLAKEIESLGVKNSEA